MRLKRFGVITVVMAMVLSLAGLASATEATTESTATTIAEGSEVEPFVLAEDPAADPLVDLVSFVIFWGGGGEGFECSPTDATETDPAGRCLEVSGPNGQVNHGTFMSAFVHWLKSEDGTTALAGYEGHRGNLIKQAAKSDFGKGQWKKDHGIIPTVDTTEALEAADTDGDGPNCDKVPAKNKHCP